MGRPKAFRPDEVVDRAKDVFWERGYQATSIADLETATGLDRSSLYHAFGSKQALFEVAAGRYVDENIDGRLRQLREPSAGLNAISDFFDGMATSFGAHPELAARGCLVVNAVAERAGRDENATSAGASYRDLFRAAFENALLAAASRGEIGQARVDPLARILTSMAMGLFLSARIDPRDAAGVASDLAAEVQGWRSRSTNRRSRVNNRRQDVT